MTIAEDTLLKGSLLDPEQNDLKAHLSYKTAILKVISLINNPNITVCYSMSLIKELFMSNIRDQRKVNPETGIENIKACKRGASNE